MRIRFQVSGATGYTVDKLSAIGVIGLTRLNDALLTSTGQSVVSHLDSCVNIADGYVDYLMPEEEEKKGEYLIRCSIR